MKSDFVPFYTYNEKERLNYSLFLDMETMNIYRNYSNSNNDFFKSGKYWVLYYLSYLLLSQLKGFQLYMNTHLAIIVFIVVGGLGFWFSYFYLHTVGQKKMEFKSAYLTKEEFISYAEAGKKTYKFILIVLVAFAIILFISMIYFIIQPSLLYLLFLPLLTFVIGGLMRAIPYRRFKLHYNKSYLEKIATSVHQQVTS